jgi:hypothetical protein
MERRNLVSARVPSHFIRSLLEISYVCLCSTGYSLVQRNNGCKWIQTGNTTPRKINTELRIKNHNLGCECINKKSSACWSIILLLFGIRSNQKDYRTTGVMPLYITAYWDRNMQLPVAYQMYSTVDGILWNILGHAVAQLVQALRYNPEGRGIDSRWCYRNFSWVRGIFPGG